MKDFAIGIAFGLIPFILGFALGWISTGTAVSVECKTEPHIMSIASKFYNCTPITVTEKK